MTMQMLDVLFGAEYPDVVRKNRPLGWGIGLFAGNYRLENGALDPYISAVGLTRQLCKDKCPAIRIQIVWSDKHAYGDKDIPLLVKEAQSYEQIAKEHPETTIILSPFCEYGPLERGIDYYIDIVKKHAPSCELVASPSQISKGVPSRKYRNEFHGAETSKQSDCDYSLDGSNAFDVDIELVKERWSKAKRFYWWIPQFNRKQKTQEDPCIPRPKRKVIPVPEQFESIVFLTGEKGKRANLDEGFILKSHADQAGPAPVGEDGRPVLLAPPNCKHAKAELLLKSGIVLTTMPYDEEWREEIKGKPVGKLRGQIYRMKDNEWGYKVMQRAYKLQKVRVLRLRIGGVIVGHVNLGFRQNNYRWD